MRLAGRVLAHTLLIVLLTALTQVGGIVWLVSLAISQLIKRKFRFKTFLIFTLLYSLTTFILVPLLAPLFGREPIVNTGQVRPTNYLTIVLNRNYVRPALNDVLRKTTADLQGSGITINYLDANFPFLNGFPLLPHLSHNDGKKLLPLDHAQDEFRLFAPKTNLLCLLRKILGIVENIWERS